MADAYVDKLSSFMGVAFGLNYFLAFGLEIGECDLIDLFLLNLLLMGLDWFLAAITHNFLHLVDTHQNMHAHAFWFPGIFKDTIMPAMMTSFGLAPPAEPFDFSSSMLSVFGGCWALVSCFANISGLVGKESADTKAARQWTNLGNWLGWTVGYGMWSFKGGQGGFFGSAFNIQWNLMFAVMLAFHLKWAGGPAGVLKKIKGD